MNQKFTLVECIVVSAIVALLLSLTVPAISKTRNKAYSLACSSQLRGIGLGIKIYANDYDGYSMPASFGDTADGKLNHFINYMIIRGGYPQEVFQCPSMDEEDMFDPAGHDPAGSNIYKKASYIMNIVKPGNWSGSGLPGSAKLHGWGLDSTTPIKIATVKEPSNKLLVMDVIAGISDSHSGVNHFRRSDHGRVSNPPTGLKRWVGVAHENRYNATFGDGHVKIVERSKAENWAVNF